MAITFCSGLKHLTRSLSRRVFRGQDGPKGSAGTLRGTPTKRQVSKRQVSKRPVSKRLKRQVYKTSGLQNVRFTKRQVYKTSGL
jgi:hypothetical protein